ncbi:MAG: 16S rRNA processing protein RimM [Bacteroidales bacterium]|nr:16S rRNA processing protein RimM [Bacteroidales bacterium]
MPSADFYYVGKTTKVVGLKGELAVSLDTDEPEKYYRMESVFLQLGEERIPFRISSIKIKSKYQLVVKFEGVEAGDAPSYVDAELYLPLSMLPPLEGNRFYYHEIKGFTMVDEEAGEIGPCTGVLEYPQQALFQIDYGGTEVLVPIVDAFIRKVDRKNRRIFLSLPQGLLDIYLHPGLE